MAVSEKAFVVVVNPRAGAGRAARLLPTLTQALHEAGARFEIVRPRDALDTTAVTRRALESGTAGVAVVGGDGTLNAAVNGFFDERGHSIARDSWLGILPVGTGGDFRRTLGVSTEPQAMVTQLLWGRARAIDVGWVSFRTHQGTEARRAFINVASFGMSGVVIDMVQSGPKWLGAPLFPLAAVRAKLSYRPRRMRIHIGEAGPSEEREVLVAAVANGRFFGGGMELAPGASVDDGAFEVLSVAPMPLRALLDLLRHLYRGGPRPGDGVVRTSAARVRVEPADWGGPVLLEIDGDALGMLPAEFEIAKAALRFRC